MKTATLKGGDQLCQRNARARRSSPPRRGGFHGTFSMPMKKLLTLLGLSAVLLCNVVNAQYVKYVTTLTQLRALNTADISKTVFVTQAGGTPDNGWFYYYDSTSLLADNATTVIAPNSGTGRWIRANSPGGGGGVGGGETNIVGSMSDLVDTNNFVVGDVSRKEWGLFNTTSRAVVQPYKYYDATYGWMHWANANVSSASYSILDHRLVAPSGATAVTFSVPMAVYGTDTGSVRIGITDSTGNVWVDFLDQVLDATPTLYTVTCAVTAGSEYIAVIQFKNVDIGLASCRALVGPPVVTYAGALSGTLAGDFKRIQVTGFFDDVEGTMRDRGIEASANARMVFRTDADSLVIEGASTLYDADNDWAVLSVEVDGRPWRSVVQDGAGGVLTFESVALPSDDLYHQVEITLPLKSRPSTTDLYSTIRAIYIPEGNVFHMGYPLPQGRRIVVYGDSIIFGDSAGTDDNLPEKQLVPMLRNNYKFDALAEGWGYRSLYWDYTNRFETLIDRIAAYKPDDVLIAIGRNDWGLDKWSAADFGLAYRELVGRLHNAVPWAKIWCQTPISQTSEAANSFGNTLGNYRTQITTVATDLNHVAQVIDGTALLDVSALQDGVHPTAEGAATYAYNLNTALDAANPSSAQPTSYQMFESLATPLYPRVFLELNGSSGLQNAIFDVHPARDNKDVAIQATTSKETDSNEVSIGLYAVGTGEKVLLYSLTNWADHASAPYIRVSPGDFDGSGGGAADFYPDKHVEFKSDIEVAGTAYVNSLVATNRISEAYVDTALTRDDEINSTVDVDAMVADDDVVWEATEQTVTGNKTFTGLLAAHGPFETLVEDQGSTAVDFSTGSSLRNYAMGANTTLTFANLTTNRWVTLRFINDATGGYSLTTPSVSWIQKYDQSPGTSPPWWRTNSYATNIVTFFVEPDSSVSGWIDGAIRSEYITLACSDETTAITAGTAKIKWRAPFPLTLVGIRGGLSTAQSSGSTFTVDVNEGGATILSTKLTFDNSEATTTTAAAQPAFSDTAIAEDAEVSVDVDAIGDGTAKGLKVTLFYYR